MIKLKNKKIIGLGLISYFSLLNITFATTFKDLALNLSNGIFMSISKLAILFAVVFFLWGVLVFVLNVDDSTKREQGKNRMFFSILALFIMLSIWGILSFFTNSVGLENGKHIQIKLDGSTYTSFLDMSNGGGNDVDPLDDDYYGGENDFNQGQSIWGDTIRDLFSGL